MLEFKNTEYTKSAEDLEPSSALRLYDTTGSS